MLSGQASAEWLVNKRRTGYHLAVRSDQENTDTHNTIDVLIDHGQGVKWHLFITFSLQEMIYPLEKKINVTSSL